MAGLTLQDAQEILSNLITAAKSGTLEVQWNNDKTRMFNSRKELDESIQYWNRQVVILERQASGRSSGSFAVGRFV